MPGRTAINITAFTVYDDVDQSDDQFDVYANASLIFRGLDSLYDDAITMDGLVRVSGQTTIDDGLTLADAATFANADMVTQNGGDLTIGETYSDAATVRNIAGAIWNLVGNTQITGAGSSQFVNLGLLEQTSVSDTTVVDVDFYDRGGTVAIQGSFDCDDFDHVERFISGALTGSGSAILTYAFFDGTNISIASINVDGTTFVGDVTDSSSTFKGGYLDLRAGAVLDLSNPAANVSLGGYNNGSGEIDIRGNDQVGLTATFNGAETIVNFGDSTFTADGSADAGPSVTATADAGSQVTIENYAGATWVDQGESALFASDGEYAMNGTGIGVFYNNGTFEDLTTNQTSFSMNVVNNDVMEAGSRTYEGPSELYGGFTFDDQVTGAGTIEIGLDQVTANALIGSGQTLEFTSVPSGATDPTLTLNDVQQFSGLIAGFDQNGATDDKIVVNTATWAYQDFVASSGGGSLVFSNGSADAYVDLSGSYQPNGFVPTVSGNQTTITYTG